MGLGYFSRKPHFQPRFQQARYMLGGSGCDIAPFVMRHNWMNWVSLNNIADSQLIVFEPSVFHPLINIETGELDVKRGFQKWRRNVNHIWQVILYARRIFYKIENQNPLNPEASVLYERDLELFKVKVAESINFCHEKLYDTSTQDPHALRFSPWEPTIHENVRKKLLSGNKEDNDTKVSTPSGLSWIQKGTLKIFSKTAS
ncbi:AKT-interacting protein-like [Tachypleus tridentatus]|uniref:AKT-interacting protein-like n=1 Tax=Tachypleus tridentatus TaxID=6853 RepID=UPI003FD1783E